MVATSTLVPPVVDAKPSSSTLLPRKDSNASSSGAFSELSRSFGYEENSSDSLYGATPSAHYIIKCNLNTNMTTPTSSSLSSTILPASPRLKVTVEQPSTTSRPSRFDSMIDSIPSSVLLKTPAFTNLPISSSSLMTSSAASSAPEFSISGTSSLDDSEEFALYEQYLSISHGRQSNPSPEIRKKIFEPNAQIQHRPLPRSKSEAHNPSSEPQQQQQQQQVAGASAAAATAANTSESKTVRKNNDFLFP